MNTNFKTVIAGCAIFALPLSAMAGAGHVWSQQERAKQEQMQEQNKAPSSAVERNTRNWSHLDLNGDQQVSAAEIQAYLNGKTAPSRLPGAQLPVDLTGLDEQRPRTLSSTELGMHFTHAADNQDASPKVFIPGTGYTEPMPKETSNNEDFNKRAMLLEVKEAMLKQERKAM